MKITTLITLPEEIYQFFVRKASQCGNCTPKQLIVETLIHYVDSSTPEQKGQQNSSTSKS